MGLVQRRQRRFRLLQACRPRRLAGVFCVGIRRRPFRNAFFPRPLVGLHARGDLFHGQRPQGAQQVGHPLDAAHPTVGRDTLQLHLNHAYHVRVKELGHVRRAQKLAQQRRVQREQRRAAFGMGQVAVVQVVAHVAEQQRRGERRRDGRLGLHQPDAARSAPLP